MLKDSKRKKVKNINYILKNERGNSYKNENKFSPLFFYDFPWSENRFDNEINKISVIKNWFYDKWLSK